MHRPFAALAWGARPPPRHFARLSRPASTPTHSAAMPPAPLDAPLAALLLLALAGRAAAAASGPGDTLLAQNATGALP